MKKILSVLITLAILLTLFNTSVFATSPNLTGGQILKSIVEEKEIEKNQIQTIDINQETVGATASYLQSYAKNNNLAKDIYGGCYIDGDGNLHVLLTQKKQDVVDTMSMIADNSLMYDLCCYTLDELTDIKDNISEMISNFDELQCCCLSLNDIVSVGVYEHENRVIVKLKDCSEEKIGEFKSKILDSDALEFECSNGYKKTATSIKAGQSIYINGGYYSVGFRCKKMRSSGDYVNGFMTAGHDNKNGDAAYISSVKVGYVLDNSYGTGSKSDAAFVYVNNSNYNVTNTLTSGKGNLVSGVYYSTYTVGTTVHKVGTTTGYTSGVITSASLNVHLDGTPVVIKDAVEANYACEEGDSGCPVYRITSSTNVVTSINFAGTDEGKASSSAFSKMNNIVPRLI